MDIKVFFYEINRLWPKSQQSPSKEMVDICQAAVVEYPKVSTLWYDLGIIMQRCGDEYNFTSADYFRCFENAVMYDQDNADAHQELGYVLDNYLDDYDRAEKAFKKAIDLGADQESYCGLARVLAQMGKVDDAIASLSESKCSFHDHPDVRHLREEILDGSWHWAEAENTKRDAK